MFTLFYLFIFYSFCISFSFLHVSLLTASPSLLSSSIDPSLIYTSPAALEPSSICMSPATTDPSPICTSPVATDQLLSTHARPLFSIFDVTACVLGLCFGLCLCFSFVFRAGFLFQALVSVWLC